MVDIKNSKKRRSSKVMKKKKLVNEEAPQMNAMTPNL